eukprot:GHVP01066399.1.p1 GENE.GHVP01066399.1~~GHVP01066399.1.p1  ORF type:complete len:164 (-),score=16.13 GHVP01066399.1:46-537(-)
MTEWINTPSGWLTLIVAASTWHKNGVSADTESSSKESFVQTQVDYKLFIMSKSCSLARIWRCYASSPPEASSEEACCTKGTSQAFVVLHCRQGPSIASLYYFFSFPNSKLFARSGRFFVSVQKQLEPSPTDSLEKLGDVSQKSAFSLNRNKFFWKKVFAVSLQ